ALLWVFVLTAISVLRRDVYGTRILSRRQAAGRPAAGRRPASSSGAVPEPSLSPGDPLPSRTGNGPRRLVVVDGPLRGTSLPLGASPILVGRAPVCTLVLDDDYSSSRHARLFPQGGQWMVEDLGSTNGTFLGSERVQSPTPVPVGVPV